MSKKITPEAFSRQAENAIADQLAMRVGRFTKAKKNRRVLAADCVKWANALYSLVDKMNEETALPSPVPPLAKYEERRNPVLVSKTTDEMVHDLYSFQSDEQVHKYLEARTAEELARLKLANMSSSLKAAVDVEMRRMD